MLCGVVFDLYGVIEIPVTSEPAHDEWCAQVLRRFLCGKGMELPVEQCKLAVQRADSFIRSSASDYAVSLHPLMWRLVLEAITGGRSSERDAQELFEFVCVSRSAERPIFEDVWDSFDRISEHYKIGILSNGHSWRIRSMLEAVGLRTKVDAVLVSGEWPFRKPDAEMFTTMASLLDMDPSSCMMVGDRLDNDVIGARSVGMGTLLLRRRSDETSSKPHASAEKASFPSLGAVADYLLGRLRDS